MRERETSIGCFPNTPQPGTKPTTFSCPDGATTKWPPRPGPTTGNCYLVSFQNHFSDSLTATGCPTIHFRSGTNCLGLACTPRTKGSVPRHWPHPGHQLQIGSPGSPHFRPADCNLGDPHTPSPSPVTVILQTDSQSSGKHNAPDHMSIRKQTPQEQPHGRDARGRVWEEGTRSTRAPVGHATLLARGRAHQSRSNLTLVLRGFLSKLHYRILKHV